MKRTLVLLLSLSLFSCKQNDEHEITTHNVENLDTNSETGKEINDGEYVMFKPDSVASPHIKGFSADYSYAVGNNKVIEGSYEPVDGNITLPDTEKDWGDRLLFLDSKGKILFKSDGVGDTYLYEPYFYKNKQNGKIIVVCQLAYEYFFGGDAFLIEDGSIKYIGNINVEPNNQEKKLTDILKIKEANSNIVFTFDTDSLVLDPGSSDIIVKNKNTRYEYDNKDFKFIK